MVDVADKVKLKDGRTGVVTEVVGGHFSVRLDAKPKGDHEHDTLGCLTEADLALPTPQRVHQAPQKGVPHAGEVRGPAKGSER